MHVGTVEKWNAFLQGTYCRMHLCASLLPCIQVGLQIFWLDVILVFKYSDWLELNRSIDEIFEFSLQQIIFANGAFPDQKTGGLSDELFPIANAPAADLASLVRSCDEELVSAPCRFINQSHCRLAKSSFLVYFASWLWLNHYNKGPSWLFMWKSMPFSELPESSCSNE